MVKETFEMINKENNENIITLCRTNDKFGIPKHIKFENNSITIGCKKFEVDKILVDKTQKECFEAIEDFVIKNAEKGFNCTLFAYGQTGSGKTHTILGNKMEEDQEGCVLRTLKYLHAKHTKIKISFIEIYNEEINDLSVVSNSSSTGKGRNLHIREKSVIFNKSHKTTQVEVEGLNVFESDSYEKSLEFFDVCFKARKTTGTVQNDKSSRSHAVFTIYLEQGEINKSTGDVNVVKCSKLTFVDLAGSEKLKENGFFEENTSKELTFKETTLINKSLMNLGIIVNSLTNKNERHVPYRDSKLTFLLKDSLGGNSKLCIIGNLNLTNESDSINTFQFLERIKKIKNSPYINYANNKKIEEVLAFLESENLRLSRHADKCEKNSIFSHEIVYNFKKIKEESVSVTQKLVEIRDTVRKMRELFFNQPFSFKQSKKDHDELCLEIKKITSDKFENIKNTVRDIK
ncbi:Kif18a [Ecytonucleospora hepatopenaei]|uniref:Kinesin-like protein n=1 Tax=Ecytonucleospora hepatopenaei TaxID=646526 RepID=A0A1W0E9C5_9MICR|nr:Kif18a [Ecytonucleospora hepatopenaei]